MWTITLLYSDMVAGGCLTLLAADKALQVKASQNDLHEGMCTNGGLHAEGNVQQVLMGLDHRTQECSSF